MQTCGGENRNRFMLFLFGSEEGAVSFSVHTASFTWLVECRYTRGAHTFFGLVFRGAPGHGTWFSPHTKCIVAVSGDGGGGGGGHFDVRFLSQRSQLLVKKQTKT